MQQFNSAPILSNLIPIVDIIIIRFRMLYSVRGIEAKILDRQIYFIL